MFEQDSDLTGEIAQELLAWPSQYPAFNPIKSFMENFSFASPSEGTS